VAGEEFLSKGAQLVVVYKTNIMEQSLINWPCYT
jgi:hypothetical protein